ncbi:MAG: hypothetical protein A2096_05465 [Spirochaetes bacterium GWF1_41_5]|nr:MAG: hypothetical protein A2096_05465 [Spirochaetes bacterium GWF1_41_5]
MSEPNPAALSGFIRQHDHFIITAHIRSDGDSIGSELALREILLSLGKKCYIFNNDEPAAYLSFLPGFAEIKNMPPSDIADYDACLIADSAFSPRLGSVYNTLQTDGPRAVAVIDHHQNPCLNDFCYIKPDASSTGELVYNLAEYLEIPVTGNIAIDIYTAVFTDTSGFRQTNTTARSLKIASMLFPEIKDHYPVMMQSIFEDNRYGGLKLMGKMLEASKRTADGLIIYSLLERRMFAETGADDSDLEHFITYLRSVRGIKAACLFRETGKDIKVNLRGKDITVDLVPFVRRYGGGGHPQAAGFSVTGKSLCQAADEIINALNLYLAG